MAEGHSALKIPASSPETVKEEQEEDDSVSSLSKTFKKLEVKHSHRFKFQFSDEEDIYTINRPRTVLEALKTNDTYNAKPYSDENVIISFFRAGKQVAIATHFPCHLIENDDVLVIDHKPGEVVEAQHEAKPSQDEGEYEGEYVTFFIDKEGGENAKKKQLFRNTAIKQFDYLCVYAEKGMTVGEAFKRDGRFNDGLNTFRLSDNKDPNCLTEYTQNIDNLNEKYFKICLDRGQQLPDPKTPQKKNL